MAEIFRPIQEDIRHGFKEFVMSGRIVLLNFSWEAQTSIENSKE